jgi:hypothetical protein
VVDVDKSRKGAASVPIMRRRCWLVGCNLSPILQMTKVGCSEVFSNGPFAIAEIHAGVTQLVES